MPGKSGGQPGLYWVTSVDELPRDTSFRKITFNEFRRRYIEPARSMGTTRRTLAVAAADALGYLDKIGPLCVLAVPCRTLGDLRDIYGYLVEPAFRHHLTLALIVERRLGDLRDVDFVDPELEYAWTLQRLRYVAERYGRSCSAGLPPMTPIEEILFRSLRALGLAPLAQYGVGPFRADFAFPDQRLIVECDGRQWHDQARDARRDEALGTRGWRVVHFTGSEITRSPDDVAQAVAQLLGAGQRTITYTELTDQAQEPRSFWARLLGFFLPRGKGRKAETESWPDVGDDAEHEPADRTPSNLDPEQQKAVASHDGVVQVIAPAGSGKTKVIVHRVSELLARGVPANRILCTTFNVAAVQELSQRLSVAGIAGVAAKNFHGIGFAVLKEEEALRQKVHTMSYPQWRRLAKQAMDQTENGEWVEPPDAQEAVSNYKLADMVTPDEARVRARDSRTKTLAKIYELYEKDLESNGWLDFDDLIINAIRLLRGDAGVRARWQEKWEYILVDEYQDIEPAQELLIRMLAAPQDALFVVGDEDQCIYAWRRARVERIIELDQAFPGLERSVLKRNYRSSREIVKLAAHLIGHNRRRFPKEILPHRDEPGAIALSQSDDVDEMGKFVAGLLAAVPADVSVAVLARTTFALKSTALACARSGMHFQAPAKLVEIGGAERTLLAYLRLFADLGQARPEDVAEVFRIPNRYLPPQAETQVADALRRDFGFSVATGTVRAERWRRQRLDEAGVFFDRLSGVGRASEFIKLIRGEGGLDRYFSQQEDMSPHDQDAIDVLADAEARAQDMSVATLAQLFEHDAELLRRFVGDEGPELSTIHGAKGREWNQVVLVAADDQTLPHRRSLESSGQTAGDDEEGLEGERRLAYVAFTRAMNTLTTCYAGIPSRFLVEAGLMSEIEWEAERRKAIARPVSRASSGPKATSTGTQRTAPSPVPATGTTRHARAYQPWSPDEDQRLRELHNDGALLPEIVLELERDPGGIRSRLRKLGLLDFV
jgi:DNA helicase-2/ATP-dependent DNA helicase PcrA